MAEKKGFISGAIQFIVGVLFAALAIYNVIRALKRAYRAVRSVGSR